MSRPANGSSKHARVVARPMTPTLTGSGATRAFGGPVAIPEALQSCCRLALRCLAPPDMPVVTTEAEPFADPAVWRQLPAYQRRYHNWLLTHYGEPKVLTLDATAPTGKLESAFCMSSALSADEGFEPWPWLREDHLPPGPPDCLCPTGLNLCPHNRPLVGQTTTSDWPDK
ncbi:unnamed protein product [Protopolystoma xenopodis]|uniref:Uncharacterized protein n=1 Tax=Protopolystoma xenopodis TaxID=117903 RepID=A0A448XEL6_9PLAT|nr:unnamed protein product [Protopolystoma xenopodis]